VNQRGIKPLIFVSGFFIATLFSKRHNLSKNSQPRTM
jgi:hypothetical protein